jgi:propionyl-CoA synthetase
LILDEEGNEQPLGKMGEIVLKEPLPPGCLTTLFENEKHCHEVYFAQYPGCYKTGDSGYLDRDRYVWVMTRTDDVINGMILQFKYSYYVHYLTIPVAGHRLSTGQLEEVVAHHHSVAECSVVGVEDALKVNEITCNYALY